MVDFNDFQRLKWYYQALLVAGAAVTLLSLFWWRFLMPIGAAIEARHVRLSDLAAEISQAVQRRMQLAEIRAESEALQEQLDRLKSILPLERETDEILREVGNIAETASMRVVRILPRPIVDRDVYSEWAWDFQVQSTYHNLGSFLDAIRQLGRIVNISGIDLTAADPGTAATVGATFTATTFVYREDKPPFASDQSDRENQADRADKVNQPGQPNRENQ